MSPIPATLIPGDGIGPEIVEAVVTILDALGKPFAWQVCRAGGNALTTDGDPLPGATVANIRKTGLALKGPLATPVGSGYRSVNVRLREELQLYANLRPVRTLIPGGRYEDIDIVMVREILDTAKELARDYGGRLTVDDRIVDACAMQLVVNPWQFDVILTTNLFGDILSDELAGLVGGLGMAPGANIGPSAAIFEAVHGSAPDIAGKGIANPVSLLLAACLMLEHVKLDALAARVRNALSAVLVQDAIRTPDLGGGATTRQFTDALIRRLQHEHSEPNHIAADV